MNIVCLDMEGVLVPEIWIAFAEASGIPELKRTTRDEPDYDKLMRWRLGILKEHGLGLKEIQATIAKIDPLPGAKAFLDELRSLTQVIIAVPAGNGVKSDGLESLHRVQLGVLKAHVKAGDLAAVRHLQGIAENGGPVQLLHERLGKFLKGVTEDHHLGQLPQLVQ